MRNEAPEHGFQVVIVHYVVQSISNESVVCDKVDLTKWELQYFEGSYNYCCTLVK